MRFFPGIRVVLCDIDGTLIDVFPIHTQSYQTALEEIVGIRIRRGTAISRYYGLGEAEIFESVLKDNNINPSKGLVEDLIKARQKVFSRLAVMVTAKNVLPGAKGFLQESKNRGIVLVAVSGNSKIVGDTLLKRSGLAGFFNATAFGDERMKGKPLSNRADILRLGVLRMEQTLKSKIRPEQMIVIGDTPADIRAAKKLKARSLAVATGSYSIEQLKKRGATFIFQNLSKELGRKEFENQPQHKENTQ